MLRFWVSIQKNKIKKVGCCWWKKIFILRNFLIFKGIVIFKNGNTLFGSWKWVIFCASKYINTNGKWTRSPPPPSTFSVQTEYSTLFFSSSFLLQFEVARLVKYRYLAFYIILFALTVNLCNRNCHIASVSVCCL